jgi:hypothetical protein
MWWKKVTKEPPDLEERLGSVERQLKDMRLEWELTHDKLVTLVARFNKRAERIAQSETVEESNLPSNAIPTGRPIATGSQPDPMSARILARRQRLFPLQRGNSTEETKQ